MRIGFISTRLAGTDGVSLETAKWATVLNRMGHEVFYCAGELEGDSPPGNLLPQMHFHDTKNKEISKHAFGYDIKLKSEEDKSRIIGELKRKIERYATKLKKEIKKFISKYNINLIICENVLAIPMHIPLGIAVTELIKETNIPTIAHHHDFYWERNRFLKNYVQDILDNYFPPDLLSIQHVVINNLAKNYLLNRRNIESTVIPNVFNFSTNPPKIDDYNRDFRKTIGLKSEDILILQPTRIVRRKGIELAIELIKKLNDERFKLVVTHHPGDEGMGYFNWLKTVAKESKVKVYWVFNQISTHRNKKDKRKIYSLWDAYLDTDFVTYPSLYEGFGNALLEAIYFKLPVLVNRYSVYKEDIRPKGFDFVEIDREITDDTVRRVSNILKNPELKKKIVNKNYKIATKYFSYELLEKRLTTLINKVNWES